MNPPNGEASPGGSRVLRYDQIPDQGFQFTMGDSGRIREIEEHIRAHIGSPDLVWHEAVSHLVHIDVHVVAPKRERPFYTLVTSGMSERPMQVSEGSGAPRYQELVLCLPASWTVNEEALRNPEWNWPILWLRMLARFPHLMNTWIGLGHTIPNSEQAEPYTPGTKLCCAMLGPAVLAPQPFWTMTRADGERVVFLGVYFLTADEMALKLEQGAQALHDRLFAAGVTELVEPQRRSALESPAQKRDVINGTVASHPARVSIRLWDLLQTVPQLASYPFGMLLAVALAWVVPFVALGLFLFLVFKARRYFLFAWKLRTMFRHGDAMPGVVTSLDPVTLAVAANLTNDGGRPYFVVKVEEQPIPPTHLRGIAVGSKVAAVAMYADRPSAPDDEPVMGRWSDVFPLMVHLVNRRRATREALLASFSPQEWEDLDAALEQVADASKPGLYPVTLPKGGPDPGASTRPLRIPAAGEPVAEASGWHVLGGDGKEYGPYTQQQLKQWVAQGLVTPRSSARHAACPQWKPLSEHPEACNILSS